MEVVFYILAFIAKGIFYIAYYTMPIAMVIGGFALGGNAGDAAGYSKYEKYEEARIDELSHRVIIKDGEEEVAVMTVREDKAWDVSGYLGYDDEEPYPTRGYDANENCVKNFGLEKSGYRFVGLYSSPEGGTRFANASGCGIRDIKSSMTLYAVYEPIDADAE